MKSMKGNQGSNTPVESQERWSGNIRPGPMERDDSDVISFERGAKPMRAGLLQTTARK